MRFDFKIVFCSNKRGGKPDALSHHPDYTLSKDTSEHIMTFLKPEQVNISLLDQNDAILIFYRLCVADTLPMEPETNTRSSTILAALSQDPDLGPFFPQIPDPALPRTEKDAPVRDKTTGC